MLAAPEFLVARPLPDLVPVEDPRGPLRVLIASLARGGAERIVLDWLDAEARRGRAIELAVLHPRANGWRAPHRVDVIERRSETADAFVAGLAARWAGTAVSTHLIDDDLLAAMWRADVATIPTVHNAREGWRNDPRKWRPPQVPHAIACAEAVRAQLLESGCAVPVFTIRHVPSAQRAAADAARREALRAEWRVAPGTLLVGAVGAFKRQKDFPRAIEILAQARRSRDAALVILGGVLDEGQLRELDDTLDRVAALGLEHHVKLPGFVDPIGPWYAACDALVCASRYEGLSMVAREALAAGLPVVALDVGGQSEIDHPNLDLLPADASTESIASRVAALPTRKTLAAAPIPRAPRVWSVACASARRLDPALETLFVTANLNAGGAQRSLVNLAAALATRHRMAVAACGETTHPAFARALETARVRHFRPAPSPDPFGIAEALLVEAARRGARSLCFWNVDPRVKLLAAKFAPRPLRLVDVSPGAYAFEELEGAREFAATATFSPEAYYERLDTLVLKHHAVEHPACRDVRVIPNGVASRPLRARAPHAPRFLVSGRIAPSKRLETIVAAFARVASAAPASELHVVGQAEPRHARYAVELFARARGLAVRVRGAMADLGHLEEDFTATVVLGTHQGCPNAVLEAMAAGIPVIANASGGTAELVRGGVTGWLLSEASPAGELAEAMRQCIERPDLAESCRRHAHEHVAAGFSLEAMARGYLDCLGESAVQA
jgi:glycosyltransferase involved in cell wall biosynthesis